ncbi:MAG: sodium:proton antiporter NhaD [Chlamydiota bacterium]
MISHFLSVPLILAVFSIGYLGIIFEHVIKLNKSAIALTIATLCWSFYFMSDSVHMAEDLQQLSHHLADISQIIFFLMGAMALVELVDSHKGFKLITDFIHTRSKRKLLWIIAGISFFLSGILDNLTTTILMISLLSKIIPAAKERILFSCIIVIAANAGGAWTPIGDVTTTMLWINGQISSMAVIKALFLPSVLSLLIPLLYYSFTMKKTNNLIAIKKEEQVQEPGAKVVFLFGIGGLVFVPIFKAITGLPPFVGMLLALGVVWLVTDFIHRDHEHRSHLKVPSILTKIDTSSVLFFLGILLSVAVLQTSGLLDSLSVWLIQDVKSLPLIATLIGIFSAVIDNVPLVAATMGMYSTTQFPMDSSFWHMIAYAAGTGGSLLIIGSSAGVAMMGMEKMDFITYFKKATFPTFIGYLAGMGLYLLLR